MRLRLALLLAVVAILSAPASAQREEQVRMLLDQMAEALRSDYEFAPTSDYETGTLTNDEEASLTFELAAGQMYAVVGVCDEDCTNIDFWLYDESDTLVLSDTEEDDVPVVSVYPTQSGPYRLTVKMVACSTEPCWYGVCIFGQ